MNYTEEGSEHLGVGLSRKNPKLAEVAARPGIPAGAIILFLSWKAGLGGGPITVLVAVSEVTPAPTLSTTDVSRSLHDPHL
jgi:hypothetical protein